MLGPREEWNVNSRSRQSRRAAGRAAAHGTRIAIDGDPTGGSRGHAGGAHHLQNPARRRHVRGALHLHGRRVRPARRGRQRGPDDVPNEGGGTRRRPAQAQTGPASRVERHGGRVRVQVLRTRRLRQPRGQTETRAILGRDTQSHARGKHPDGSRRAHRGRRAVGNAGERRVSVGDTREGRGRGDTRRGSLPRARKRRRPRRRHAFIPHRSHHPAKQRRRGERGRRGRACEDRYVFRGGWGRRREGERRWRSR